MNRTLDKIKEWRIGRREFQAKKKFFKKKKKWSANSEVRVSSAYWKSNKKMSVTKKFINQKLIGDKVGGLVMSWVMQSHLHEVKFGFYSEWIRRYSRIWAEECVIWFIFIHDPSGCCVEKCLLVERIETVRIIRKTLQLHNCRKWV